MCLVKEIGGNSMIQIFGEVPLLFSNHLACQVWFVPDLGPLRQMFGVWAAQAGEYLIKIPNKSFR